MTNPGISRVLPSVPLALHRRSCDEVLVCFHGVTMSFITTDTNDKFFFGIEEHHE